MPADRRERLENGRSTTLLTIGDLKADVGLTNVYYKRHVTCARCAGNLEKIVNDRSNVSTVEYSRLVSFLTPRQCYQSAIEEK